MVTAPRSRVHQCSVSTFPHRRTPRKYCRRVAADYLLVIGDREPLAWILSEGLMAFPAHRSREAGQVSQGDRLFLYTTRGCFHSPGRDRGRVIGEATVTSPVRSLKEPVEFGEHAFPLGCSLDITGLVPRDEGPEMIEMVDELNLFPSSDPKSWGVRLRRVLAPLDKHDAAVLHRKLTRGMKSLSEAKAGYLDRTRFAGSARS